MSRSEPPTNVSPAGPAVTPAKPAVSPSTPGRAGGEGEPNIIAVPEAFDDYYGVDSGPSVTKSVLEPVVAEAELAPARTVAPREARARIALDAPAIEVTGLRKVFGDTVAVDDVSLVAATGSVLAVLGPNGAGKTTTVNMLTTLLRPDGGTARVAGFDVVSQAAQVRRSIALTGQFAALDEALSGRDNLVLFGRLHGMDKRAAQVRADELLADFDLVDAGARQVSKYSGGMRRRIDIACGLVVSPRVFFLDEPTTGLDPRSRQEVWSLIERLKEQGVTVLLTTQYLEEADLLSDYIVVIDHGRVIASGTAEQLKAATGGTVCEVTPARIDDLPALAQALGGLLPADGGIGETSVSVPAAAGAEVLVEVVRRAGEAGIAIADIAMRSPSLDDVFFQLTGPGQPTDTPLSVD
ncbi:hypothetical protein nbrc107697_34570 [Gordonia crocea]|uniref:ABC transporter domain-containing protein n=1 Tax=Gordonia crocea TaxID=589162 RepID=A0A7I9V1V0_9ACTN|nr:hypothetical protein nbrc107697_34570 [Gordonia crocea]